MANNLIQIKRSNTSATPANTLVSGELAYSYNSNALFIGAQTGISAAGFKVGGSKFGFLDNASQGVLTANAAQIVDANAFISNTYTSGLFVAPSIASPVANSTAALITSISPSATGSQLGATAGGSNTELVTSWAIKTYVDGKSAASSVNTAAQYAWTNTHTFGANVSYITTGTVVAFGNSTVAVAISANGSNGTSGQSLLSNGTSVYWGTPTGLFSNGTAYIFSAPQTFNANVVLTSGNTTNFLQVGTTTTNVSINATSITLSPSSNLFIGNATVNGTIFANTTNVYFTGIAFTANNATNLNGQAASFYTNATNITTGTLPWAQAPSGTVNTSGAFTISGAHTHTANVVLVGNSLSVLSVGNTTTNTVINSTAIVAQSNSAQFGTAFYSFANGFVSIGNNAPSNTFSVNGNQFLSGKLQLGAMVGYDFGAGALIEIDANQNTYAQFVMQNANNGIAASGDLVITADTGNDSVNFLDIGINSSGYNQAAYNIGGALDAYIYSSNSNLTIGTASAREVVFHAGGTTSTDRKLTINATAVTFANSVALVANGANGTSGQVLTSNGTGLYWSTPSTFSNGTAYTWSAVQTFNANVAVAGNATSQVLVGTTAANIVINQSTFTATVNATANATVNSTTFNVSNGSTRVFMDITGVDVGNGAANATLTSTALSLTVNSTANSVVNSTVLSTSNGTAYTNLAVTGISTSAGSILVGNTATNVAINATAVSVGAAALTSSSLSVGNTATNVSINTTAVAIGTATVNSTVYTGTANNATNLNGQPASFYTNATNITTGTLPVAQLPANIVFWSNTNTFTANQTFNVAAITSGNATSYFAAGTGAANGVVNASAVTLTVNSTASAFVNSTAHAVSNGTILTSLTVAGVAVGNTAANGVLSATALSLTVNSTANSIVNSTIHSTSNGSAYSNLEVTGFSTSAGVVRVGNTTTNVVINTTAVAIGTTTVNSTIYSGTANNATNLNGQAASFYTNATNITTGTLPYAQLPANVVIWSNTNTFTANQSFNAVAFTGGNATSYFAAGTTAANAVINATAIAVQNATSVTTLSAANITSPSAVIGGQITANSTVVTFGAVSNISAGSANLTVNNILATGNLTVQGTISAIDTTTLQVKDNVILLADTNTTGDAVDFGVVGQANSGTAGTQTFYGFARIASSNSFQFFATNTAPGAATIASQTTMPLQAFLQPYGSGGAFVVNSTAVTATANATVAVNITANTLTLTTPLAATSGGTGRSTGFTTGDLLYAGSSTVLANLAIGTNGQILEVRNNLPAWGTLDGGTF